MKWFALLLAVLLSGRTLCAQQSEVAPKQDKPISESQAIEIATRFIKAKAPQLDISRQEPRATFFADYRPFIHHHVLVGMFGHVFPAVLRTSP